MEQQGIEEAKYGVLKKAKEARVKFIGLWFSDILGMLKELAITVDGLEKALEDGVGFDGSSIEGFARIDESDMRAMPDPHTFQVLPWRSMESHATARMFCDIVKPGGEAFEGDPRLVLKKNLKAAADLGYTYHVGPELEFFYFKDARGTEVLDEGGYFDATPVQLVSDLMRDTVLALQKMGIRVEISHHEGAASQHEINLKYTDALTMADSVITCRQAVKRIALRHGIHATFMPKPVSGTDGSGMHVHQSLFQNGRDIFLDLTDGYLLSRAARCFIAGLLKHAREITAVTNQWVNSYKRLIPGYQAPVYLSWARRNRADLIRIPEYKLGKETETRIELRSPDPACNPYLCFSVMLAAGLDGIKKGLMPPDPVEENVCEMSDEERRHRGIERLPTNLSEAIQLAESSELVQETFGEHVFRAFIENKKEEWDRYGAQVSDNELKRYLPVL